MTTAGENTYKTAGKSLCKTDKAFTWRQQRSLLSGSQSLHSRHVPWRPWVECSCNLEAKSQMIVINEIFFTMSQDPRCISKRMQQLKVQPRLVDLKRLASAPFGPPVLCWACELWAFPPPREPLRWCKETRRLQGNTGHQSHKVMYGTAPPPLQTASKNKGTTRYWNSHAQAHTHTCFFQY